MEPENELAGTPWYLQETTPHGYYLSLLAKVDYGQTELLQVLVVVHPLVG